MIEAPANHNTSWVITFEQHIKIASNLVKVSSIPQPITLTNFSVKFYVEVSYWKNIDISKRFINFYDEIHEKKPTTTETKSMFSFS